MKRKNIFDNFHSGSDESSGEEPSKNKQPLFKKRKTSKVDSFDTFLTNLQEKEQSKSLKEKPSRIRHERFEEIDNPEVFYNEEGENEKESKNVFDDTGEPTKKIYKKNIEFLPKINHDTINYRSVHKVILSPIFFKSYNYPQIKTLREKRNIVVRGLDCHQYPPIDLFEDVEEKVNEGGISKKMVKNLIENKILKPTAIQSQCITVALNGRDVIGVAKTGSGKTIAYSIPVICHVLYQKRKKGPIGMIIAPTRELAQQIYFVNKTYTKGLSNKGKGINVCLLVGGCDKNAQFKDMKRGCDILIGTPGRIIDLLKMKAFDCTDISIVVLDEADRMFELGFEKQVSALLSQMRFDRQNLFFSATFNKTCQRLANEVMVDPIEIIVGKIGKANENIKQTVYVLQTQETKWNALVNVVEKKVNNINNDSGSILIFVKTRKQTEEISTKLCEVGFLSASISGDKSVEERENVILAFRKKTIRILVCTDVASRGLDIPNVNLVINYDIPKSVTVYINRIGRTARGENEKGEAITFITKSEKYFAPFLVNTIENAGQQPSKNLLKLAKKNPSFKRDRQKTDKKVDNNRIDDDNDMVDEEIGKPRFYNPIKNDSQNTSSYLQHINRQYERAFVYSETQYHDNSDHIEIIYPKKNGFDDDVVMEQKIVKIPFKSAY